MHVPLPLQASQFVALHAEVHVPFTHTSQFAALQVLVQVPLVQVSQGPVQLFVQTPIWQLVQPGQTLPQNPQLVLLVCKSTHRFSLAQKVCPGGH